MEKEELLGHVRGCITEIFTRASPERLEGP